MLFDILSEMNTSIRKHRRALLSEMPGSFLEIGGFSHDLLNG